MEVKKEVGIETYLFTLLATFERNIKVSTLALSTTLRKAEKSLLKCESAKIGSSLTKKCYKNDLKPIETQCYKNKYNKNAELVLIIILVHTLLELTSKYVI